MTASSPSVVYRQIIRNDARKVLANFAAATPEQREEYRNYRDPDKNVLIKSMLEAAVAYGDPSVVRGVLALGPAFGPDENSKGVWNRFSNRRDKINGLEDRDKSTRLSVKIDQIFDILLSNKIGAHDLIGKGWGPVHIMTSSTNDRPKAEVSLLKKMKSHGYGIDDVDEIGETPLAVALWDLNAPVAQWLIEEGANLSGKTTGGRSLLDFVFRSIGNEKKKKEERIPEILQCVSILVDAGYDLAADLPNRDKMLAGWSDQEGDNAWGLVYSLEEQKRLQATTAPASGRRSSPRL